MDWPSSLLPQQVMVPLVRKPHENQSAVVTAVNRPVGGEEARRREPPVAPRIVHLALLKSELGI